jgi:hypothetical protein
MKPSVSLGIIIQQQAKLQESAENAGFRSANEAFFKKTCTLEKLVYKDKQVSSEIKG